MGGSADMVKRLLLCLLLTVGAFAAPYWPAWNPPTNFWASAGTSKFADGPVIDVTANGLDNTGSSFNDAALAALVNLYGPNENQTVLYFPPGTYKFASTFTMQGPGGGQLYRRMTFRGSVDTGGNPTSLWITRGPTAFQCGLASAWDSNYHPTTITSGLTRGSNSVVVSDGTNFNPFGLMRIELQQDPNRTWNVYSEPGKRYEFFTVRATGKTLVSGTAYAMTLDQVIPGDYSSAQSTGAIISQVPTAAGLTYGIGLENFRFTADTGYSLSVGVDFQSMTLSWIDNCRVDLPAGNYGMKFTDMTHCNITSCWVEGPGGSSSNHSAYLANTISGCIFEGNIGVNTFPGVEVNFGTLGCVFSYNYLNGTLGFMYSSHAPQDSANLYEGNFAPAFIADNFFGGVWYDTVFRSWHTAVALKRFSRSASLAANIWSYSGATVGNVVALGDPFIGNENSYGTANSLTGSWWLSTTTGTGRLWYFTVNSVSGDSKSGTMTLDSGDVSSFTTNYNNIKNNVENPALFGYFAHDITVDSLAGALVTVSNAQGPIPAVGLRAFFTPGTRGYYEKDLAVDATTEQAANWRLDYGGWGPAPVGGVTYPSSLYRSDDSGLHSGGSITWPYIDPTNPGTKVVSPTVSQVIPSIYRFYNSAWPDSTTTATPTFSPSAGTYTSAQTVSISCSTTGATIYYTTNGSTPTTGSAVYSTPLTVSSTTTVKALATKSGLSDSGIGSATYTISSGSGGNATVSGRLLIPTGGTIKISP